MAACPACSEPAADGAEWCEACGADLDGDAESALATPDAPPCVSCGEPGTSIAADGYCGNCGHKQPDARDHLEIDQTPVVLVTDRGKRHHRNEDMGAIGRVDQAVVLVVCDGVSTTDNPEQASLAAAEAARDSLVEAIETDSTLLADNERRDVALRAAIERAQAAAVEIPKITGGKGSPSCTIVVGVAEPVADNTDQIAVSVAWLGDSRAYWVTADAATQLTMDHSWAQEQIADGLMEAEAANADARAHTITRWLGADAHLLEPGMASTVVDPGRFLLCSDGLWNYAADDPAMTIQMAAHTSEPDSLLGTAQNLVRFALDSGGLDNTTVALADYRTGSLPEPSPVTTAQPIDNNDDQASEDDATTAPIESYVGPDPSQQHEPTQHLPPEDTSVD